MNQTAVPFLLRVMGAALLYFILPSVALGCSQAQSSNPNPVPPPTPLDQIGEHLGFFAKMPGKDHFEFHRWESEETINEVLWHMKYKSGGEIHFAPGTYEIRQWIFVNEIPDLRITGSPGVQLVFAEGPDVLSRNKNAINKDDLSIAVEDPELFRVDGRYQMYMADGRGDRILEFEVTKIEEDRVFLKFPAVFMPHVDHVPEGSQIMEELNFFRVRRCPNFVLQNISMDGRNRGGIRGHTTYCGIYATGLYKAHERATTLGFHVQGCTFKNLKGRGLVFYGMADCLIENNYFENIRAQAMEIDHFSSGHIRNNFVNGAEVGVMVNDAYESIVEHNVLVNCQHAVRFLEIYKDDWVNSGNIIRENRIGPGCRAGVMFFNEGMVDNLVTGNTFIGLGKKYQVMNGENNRIEQDE